MQVTRIAFQPHGDERGQLVALEQDMEIPFHIKRVYYLYDTKEGVRRGFHSHRKLEQILVCVSGSCKVLLDSGSEREVVCLDNPCEGLYIASNIWREMYDFTHDAVLLVLASELYDETDYIRNYDDFLASLKQDDVRGVPHIVVSGDAMLGSPVSEDATVCPTFSGEGESCR